MNEMEKKQKIVDYINGMGVEEKIALHKRRTMTMSKTLLKKITMETCGGDSRAYPGTGCVYVLGTAELTEEESAVLADAKENAYERKVRVPLKVGYDETEVTLEFYEIIASATVRVECDSVEVYGELYYPDKYEIEEAVEALPESVYAELFDGMTDEEIEEAVVDAGLCEAVDNRCGHVLKAAVKKACKAAGLSWKSVEFKPFAMWED